MDDHDDHSWSLKFICFGGLRNANEGLKATRTWPYVKSLRRYVDRKHQKLPFRLPHWRLNRREYSHHKAYIVRNLSHWHTFLLLIVGPTRQLSPKSTGKNSERNDAKTEFNVKWRFKIIQDHSLYFWGQRKADDRLNIWQCWHYF